VAEIFLGIIFLFMFRVCSLCNQLFKSQFSWILPSQTIETNVFKSTQSLVQFFQSKTNRFDFF